MRHNNLTMNYNKSPNRKARVWFPGTTQVRKGMGLCFDPNEVGTGTGQTATDKWGRRGNTVYVPSSTYNRWFAGVSTQDYPAKSTGQVIDIWLPGSICEVALGVATTIGTTPAMSPRITCSASSADGGRFTLAGMPGRGSAIPLQTIARADGGDIAFASWDGSMTTAWTTVTTITKTGIGTACGNGDSSIDPTDFVIVIVGGGTTATGVTPVTTGAYAVTTAPTADTITIATNISSASDASAITGYVIKNSYPTVLAYLEDGPESGLQQVITPDNNTAVASMTEGTTFVAGGMTLAANSTYTLPDGNLDGMTKAFAGLGTLTTSDYQITVTSGIENDQSALAGIAIDAANEFIILKWLGSLGGGTSGVWAEQASAGVGKS